MRRLAVLGVLAGCNQIFGLDATTYVEPDAPIPPVELRPVKLSYLVAPANGTEPGTLEVEPALDANPRIARLDEDFTAATVEDGNVMYPVTYLGAVWRLEYTDREGVPHEIQWRPAEGAGHAIIPIFGPVMRTRLAPNTGYNVFDGTAPSHQFVDGVVYTTGYWTATPAPTNTVQVTVDLSMSPSLSGGFGTPGARDEVIAIDYRNDASGCRVTSTAFRKAIGPGTGEVPPPMAGVMQNVDAVMAGGSESVILRVPEDFPKIPGRIAAALGGSDVGTRSGVERQEMVYGRFAHADMPAFTQQYAGVPAPLMIPLVSCPITAALFDASRPSKGDLVTPNHNELVVSFDKRMFAYAVNERVVQGVALPSSIVATGGEVATDDYRVVAFPVPIAITPRFGTADLGDQRLDGTSLGSTPGDVTFELEQEPATQLDYFEVILYRLTATALAPVRVFVGPDPLTRRIRFDPAILADGQTYVFAIRTYVGRPNADLNDFRPVADPQAVATVFTRTFTK